MRNEVFFYHSILTIHMRNVFIIMFSPYCTTCCRMNGDKIYVSYVINTLKIYLPYHIKKCLFLAYCTRKILILEVNYDGSKSNTLCLTPKWESRLNIVILKGIMSINIEIPSVVDTLKPHMTEGASKEALWLLLSDKTNCMNTFDVNKIYTNRQCIRNFLKLFKTYVKHKI